MFEYEVRTCPRGELAWWLTKWNDQGGWRPVTLHDVYSSSKPDVPIDVLLERPVSR